MYTYMCVHIPERWSWCPLDDVARMDAYAAHFYSVFEDISAVEF